MGRKLSNMTTSQFKAELSIAGSPDKIMKIYDNLLTAMVEIDETNPAELINMEFLMRRLAAEAKTWIRVYEQRTGQKII